MGTERESAARIDLGAAFVGFSQASQSLSANYQSLETRVIQLRNELTRSQQERLQQDAENARLATRLRLLLDVLPGGVVVIDRDGRIQETNATARSLLCDDLPGNLWRDVAARCFRSNAGQGLTLHDGRHVELAIRSLAPEPGQILLITDVTATRHLQTQIGRLMRLSEMGKMVASPAHQIRTPVATALLEVSSLRSLLPREGRARRILTRMADSLRRLEGLVGSMLRFASQGNFDVSPMNVDELLDDFVTRLETSAPDIVVHVRQPTGHRAPGRTCLLRGYRKCVAECRQQCPAMHDPRVWCCI